MHNVFYSKIYEKLLVGNVRKHMKVKSEIQEGNDLILKNLLFIQIISMLVVNDHIILC